MSRVSEAMSSNNHSKNEIDKIQDLFFYDESVVSHAKGHDEVHEPDNLTSDKHMLSTFLDSPISLATEKSSTETTPVFRKNEPKFVKVNDILSTNNSVEKFRRSSSMPGLNEPNLSIQANSSKITTLKCKHIWASSTLTYCVMHYGISVSPHVFSRNVTYKKHDKWKDP